MSTVENLGQKLARQDFQVDTLHQLLQLAAKGHDVSLVGEKVVRYCLYSSTSTTPEVLSLSLDVLNASPSHSFWVDSISVIIENLQRSATSACLTVVSKIPSLPHAALQHLILYASSHIIDAVKSDSSPAIRRAATVAIAAFVLRDRPLTAPSTEPVRLEQLNEEQIRIVKHAIERLLFALSEAIFDPKDEVAVSALSVLTQFAIDADATLNSSVLNGTKEAMAHSIWSILLPTAGRIAARFNELLTNSRSIAHQEEHRKSPQTVNTSSTLSFRYRKQAIKSISRLVAHALNLKFTYDTEDDDADQNTASAILNGEHRVQNPAKWAISWTDKTLSSICEDSNAEVASSASSSLLLICSYAGTNPSAEKVAKWGIKAVTRISRILQEQEKRLSMIVSTALVRDASHGLAALSKNEYVTSKFVAASTVALLPFACKCPRQIARLETMSVLASTAIEYDLSGRDAGIGVSVKAVLSSPPWKDIINTGSEDSSVASELVCCFSQSLLEASRKIYKCPDPTRLNLTGIWAVMLSQVIGHTYMCLRWPYSPASGYAKELFLKLFEALGQYSAFVALQQGVGMEEYERLQELLVKELMSQDDVATRAALLSCVTKYWLTSGLKAESHAGHVLKAIWKHAQEHYKDDEIILKELETGALWSEAQKGYRPPQAARSVPGGYISFAAAISKRTREVVSTVGANVSTAIETTLFGSIALATAASEGSTLTTDFAYSSLSALIALVARNPRMAEKGITTLNQYIAILDKAESSDFIALEAVRNTIAALKMYQDEFFPKPVPARAISVSATGAADEGKNKLAWMGLITESCVFSTSRLDDPSREIGTVRTEESILHIASAAKRRMHPFNATTIRNLDSVGQENIEGDQQVLNGASDPFSVVASHSMDTVKGLALVRVVVINRTKFQANNASLTYSASGALMPLPDASTSYALGNLTYGMNVTQPITLAVRRNHGFAGQVFFSIHLSRGELEEDVANEEQICAPYYIASSDVLLLRKPALGAGVDVFRRRWDLMRYSISFHVLIRKSQSVDIFVDTLERRSKCLREVGRMRTYSHVTTLVADSSRGDYVSVAGVAPEATGESGFGPCIIYVTIRSNSDGYNKAFRKECREWLTPQFRVLLLDEDKSLEEKMVALRPQDAYFITQPAGNISPYQRWRQAHSVRVTY